MKVYNDAKHNNNKQTNKQTKHLMSKGNSIVYSVKSPQTHCKVHHIYRWILWEFDQVCKMSYQNKSWKVAKPQVNSEEIAPP